MRHAAFLAVLTLTACKGAEVAPAAAAPELTAQDLQVAEQSLTDFTMSLSAKLMGHAKGTVKRAQWELVVDGAVVKKGTQTYDAALDGAQPADLQLKVQSQYVADAEALKAMDTRGGSLLCALRGAFEVQEGAELRTVAFARSKEVRVPRLPHLKAPEFEAGRYSEDEAGVTFHLGVDNPNPFEVTIQSLSYEVVLAGKKVSDGDVGKGERIRPSSTGVFDLEAKLSQESHPAAEVKKIIKSRSIPYEVKGQLQAGLFSAPFAYTGTITLPAAK